MQQWNLKLCNLSWERIVNHVDVVVGFGMLQVESSKGQWLLEIGGVGWGCWRFGGRSLGLLGE